jgi:hypothetical protein
MNEENILNKLGRVLYSKNVKISKWQVDKTVQIPVRQGCIPIPLWIPHRLTRSTGERPLLSLRLAAFAAILLTSCASLSAKASQSVSISWDAAADASAKGYIVYAGKSGTNYTAQMDVGTNTSVTFTGMTEGTTNYFAVSAYNAANIVSAPSSAITYIVPGKLSMKTKSAPTSAAALTFATAPGHYYQVQASTDMINWTTVYQTATATNNATVEYDDPQASSMSKRYYRLLMH